MSTEFNPSRFDHFDPEESKILAAVTAEISGQILINVLKGRGDDLPDGLELADVANQFKTLSVLSVEAAISGGMVEADDEQVPTMGVINTLTEAIENGSVSALREGLGMDDDEGGAFNIFGGTD